MTHEPFTQADFGILKQEVDGLQVALSAQQQPWYKKASTQIAMAALALSAFTTIASEHRIGEQSKQQARSELRRILLTQAELPLQNQELMSKYTANPQMANFLSGYINQKNTILSNQTIEIMNQYPNEEYSSAEYYAAGIALQSSYDIAGSYAYFEKAAATARTLNDKTVSLRYQASTLFQMREPGKGREIFSLALEATDSDNGSNQFTRSQMNFYTEQSWAWSEAFFGERQLAQEHIARAETHLSAMGQGPMQIGMKQAIEQLKIDMTKPAPLLPNMTTPDTLMIKASP